MENGHMATSRHYRVVTYLAEGREVVHTGNGHPFTKYAASRFARLQARAPANVVRVEVHAVAVETIETLVPPAVAKALAQTEAGKRLASPSASTASQSA
jgi:hypothetical protein